MQNTEKIQKENKKDLTRIRVNEKIVRTKFGAEQIGTYLGRER